MRTQDAPGRLGSPRGDEGGDGAFAGLMSVPHAARELDMTDRALRGRIYRREIPIVKIGRRVFLDRVRVARWLADHTHGCRS